VLRCLEARSTAYQIEKESKCMVKLLVKLLPQSDEIMLGPPKCENALKRLSQTDFAVRFFSKLTNGHLVCEQMTFNMYLWFIDDGGLIGQMMSIIRCSLKEARPLNWSYWNSILDK
jgi:hypothetical protein